MPPPAHPYLPRPGKEFMAQAVDGAPAKGVKTTKPACRRAKSMMHARNGHDTPNPCFVFDHTTALIDRD